MSLELSRDELAEEISEFIQHRQEQVNRLNQEEFTSPAVDGSARTGAKEIDRASHIKTAVIDNQDRLLNQTIILDSAESKVFNAAEERIRNIETHLGVMVAPCDSDLYARIKAVEDKILKIEQHYPQIAGHCFNYGRAERDASHRPGGRVSKADVKKTRIRIPVNTGSVQEIHDKMLELKSKIVKRK